MKQCRRCHIEKPLSEFNIYTRSGDGVQPYCRECQSAWYRANREEHLRHVRANNKRYKLTGQRWIRQYLENHPCVDCGETDPVVLEFDHVRGAKIANVSAMVLKNRNSLTMVQNEVEKCDVRCANCHRRKTAIEFNWHASVAEMDTALGF